MQVLKSLPLTNADLAECEQAEFCGLAADRTIKRSSCFWELAVERQANVMLVQPANRPDQRVSPNVYTTTQSF